MKANNNAEQRRGGERGRLKLPVTKARETVKTVESIMGTRTTHMNVGVNESGLTAVSVTPWRNAQRPDLEKSACLRRRLHAGRGICLEAGTPPARFTARIGIEVCRPPLNHEKPAP